VCTVGAPFVAAGLPGTAGAVLVILGEFVLQPADDRKLSWKWDFAWSVGFVVFSFLCSMVGLLKVVGNTPVKRSAEFACDALPVSIVAGTCLIVGSGDTAPAWLHEPWQIITIVAMVWHIVTWLLLVLFYYVFGWPLSLPRMPSPYVLWVADSVCILLTAVVLSWRQCGQVYHGPVAGYA
jgi:hypothetical protein